MKDDIRKETCLIIRKNHEYLQGGILYSKDLKWTIYKYDAWRTRDIEKAEEYARKCGGIVMLFNPISKQIRVF